MLNKAGATCPGGRLRRSQRSVGEVARAVREVARAVREVTQRGCEESMLS